MQASLNNLDKQMPIAVSAVKEDTMGPASGYFAQIVQHFSKNIEQYNSPKFGKERALISLILS